MTSSRFWTPEAAEVVVAADELELVDVLAFSVDFVVGVLWVVWTEDDEE